MLYDAVSSGGPELGVLHYNRRTISIDTDFEYSGAHSSDLQFKLNLYGYGLVCVCVQCAEETSNAFLAFVHAPPVHVWHSQTSMSLTIALIQTHFVLCTQACTTQTTHIHTLRYMTDLKSIFTHESIKFGGNPITITYIG